MMKSKSRPGPMTRRSRGCSSAASASIMAPLGNVPCDVPTMGSGQSAWSHSHSERAFDALQTLAARPKESPHRLIQPARGQICTGRRSNMHWRHRVNDINHSRPRDGTRILPVVDQGGNHRAVDRANQC